MAGRRDQEKVVAGVQVRVATSPTRRRDLSAAQVGGTPASEFPPSVAPPSNAAASEDPASMVAASGVAASGAAASAPASPAAPASTPDDPPGARAQAATRMASHIHRDMASIVLAHL